MPNHWFICSRCNLESPEANYDRLPDGWVHLGVSETLAPLEYKKGCFLCPCCAAPILQMCREACPEAPPPDVILGPDDEAPSES